MTSRQLPIQVRAYPAMDKAPRKPKPKRPINMILTFDCETCIQYSQRLHFGCFRLSTVRENDDGTLDLICVREGIFYADDLEEFNPDGFAEIRRYCLDDETRQADITRDLPFRDGGEVSQFPHYDDWQHGQLDVMPDDTFEIMPASKFVSEYLIGFGYRSKNRNENRDFEPATIVGFNLPFDMTRLGKSWTTGRKQFYGNFSVKLTGDDRPGNGLWFKLKKSGAKGHYMTITGGDKGDTDYDKDQEIQDACNLLDLSTLVFALAGKPMSLRSAGEAFGCRWLKSKAEDGHGKITKDYIDYCRNDVRATEDLYQHVMEDWQKHPVSQSLKPDSAYSPASVSKQYMRHMGIVSPLVSQKWIPVESLPGELRRGITTRLESKDGKPSKVVVKRIGGLMITREALKRLAQSRSLPMPDIGQSPIPAADIARFMAAFYGGRSECRIRLSKVPAVLCDFTSMYPTVMSLMGIWEMLTADRMSITETDPMEVESFLESLTMTHEPGRYGWKTSLFNPAMWPKLTGVAETTAGYLPIRSEYHKESGNAPGIGINDLESFAPIPYTLLDLAASRIATGQTPHITRAWMLEASETKQASLTPVDLYGDSRLRLDPHTGNLLKMAVEQRQVAKRRHADHRMEARADALDPTCPCRFERRPCAACLNFMHLESGLTYLRNYKDPANMYYSAPIHELNMEAARQVSNLELASNRVTKSHANDNRRDVWTENRDTCLCHECVGERFLKVFANAIYGVFAEMNTPKSATPKNGKVYGHDGHVWETPNPDKPGEYCFPPFASLITAGARLMLAMLETSVAKENGCHAFCDTDSLCIVAAPEAGNVEGIPVISYDSVEAIRQRFNLLNPYDPDLVPEILKWDTPGSMPLPGDKQLYCIAISAKRYALFYENPDGTIKIEKNTEHGLGLYLNPKSRPTEWGCSDCAKRDRFCNQHNWCTETWRYIIEKYINDRSPVEPEWFRNPAVMRLNATSPDVLHAFDKFNAKPEDLGEDNPWGYADQVKPHNFLLAFPLSRIARIMYPDMRLVSPYASPEELARYATPEELAECDNPADLADYRNLFDIYDIHGDGTPLRISTRSEMTSDDLAAFLQSDNGYGTPNTELPMFTDDQVIPVMSYREIIHQYVTHPEIKYDDFAGKRCGPTTRGRLYPTTVEVQEIISIGKTSNQYYDAYYDAADRTLDSRHSPVYGSADRQAQALDIARNILKDYGNSAIARLLESECGASVSINTVRNIKEKSVTSRPETSQAFIRLARKVIEPELAALLGATVEELNRKILSGRDDVFVIKTWRNQKRKQ